MNDYEWSACEYTQIFKDYLCTSYNIYGCTSKNLYRQKMASDMTSERNICHVMGHAPSSTGRPRNFAYYEERVFSQVGSFALNACRT